MEKANEGVRNGAGEGWRRERVEKASDGVWRKDMVGEGAGGGVEQTRGAWAVGGAIVTKTTAAKGGEGRRRAEKGREGWRRMEKVGEGQ